MSGFVGKLPFFHPLPPNHKETEEIVRKGESDVELGSEVVGAGSTADGDQIGNMKQPLPFLFEFTNLYYSVKKPKKIMPLASLPSFNNRLASDTTTSAVDLSRTKILLNNISGKAREGEIFAVLGASGSGKSTLIDALADRISRESLRGSITLNGEPIDSRLMKMISAYVMQDDLLFPMLTVEETLMFSAEFRLPRALPASKKKARVEALIDQLGLRNAASTIIGDEGHRGVSGGERRRVSIGTDIIHDPILLFLDEPTSGLDSSSAFMVVQVIKKIAESGSVVIMTIHQPSYRIIGLLNHVLFLSRGQTVYSGPPNGLHNFFAEFGQPIPEHENPTEFALDLIRELEYNDPSSGAKSLVEFNSMYQAKVSKPAKPSYAASPLTLRDAIAASVSRGRLGASMDEFANPFWIEVGVLTKRSFTNTKRMPELFVMRLGTIMVTGFILATIFWRLDASPKGVQERLGFFAMAMSTMFYVCADALPVFLQERYIYLRETSHNAYRKASYVISNAIVAFPPLVFLSLAFALITFFAVGLAGGSSAFLFFVLIILASFWAGTGFVSFLSAVVPHVMIGYTVVVAILAYFLLFSGFFINRDRIPDYWIWFHYLSLVKYPYEAVLQNEFDRSNTCFSRGVQMFFGTPIGKMNGTVQEKVLAAISQTLKSNLTTTSCIATGSDILKEQAVTQLSKWNCLFVTVAWGFLFRFLFYIILLLGNKNKRK
ncbi:ABC transporter G family member 2 [Rhynchospora pubera]|uniref:ABC transporter G family member 5 n=1 Tax=Rhynchospora pubera TaxID=906938 RepID=A0AAV8BNQ3_9POAL|nr:ABC transporter G family member 2 [Rhynchospora pubera]KAJ4804556.1 ABC transporter G family member 2 [Rhynchospora pubera]